mgnify:CR=1 FL=1
MITKTKDNNIPTFKLDPIEDAINAIKNGEVINISSIINSSIIGDKTIYNLYSHSKYIYVCTGRYVDT